MDKREFVELCNDSIGYLQNKECQPVSDEDFEIIYYVYSHHPLFIGNKYDVVRAYAALGIDLFKSLYPIAKQFDELWDKCFQANRMWLGLESDARTAREAGLDKLAERLEIKATVAKADDKRYEDEYRQLLKFYSLEEYIDI